ncbi:Non-heme dioxygenase N-terminal domain containing protein [Parasponia andersonii]|uniref:Non-heme dioxygenase N-terminal domain containing protein n=1 Tax=Parasponia andersonii TaxID=3476 RepID=A0A2P5BZU4_PARAD|nr:Non-heme dioxygenase N-terminal domain containing protein [Parasponia andersonii]
MAPANSPESLAADYQINFRAPPPSPVHSGRRSSFANDSVLTEYLEHSLRVPDLILPDKIFPKQMFVETPPAIDFDSLISEECDAVSKIMEIVADFGCFQVANHGISSEFVRSVQAAGAGIFAVPQDKRAAVTRSQEMPYGFEEVHGEEGGSESESESSEEFVWGMDDRLKSLMEGFWPLGYSNFCKRMEVLLTNIEKVAEKVFSIIFLKNPRRKSMFGNDIVWQGQDITGTLCCLYKNTRSFVSDDSAESLRHEVIRMLIRRNDHSHALCLHFCGGGSTEFHVCSKRGWVSFIPQKDALVITIGDQIQTWSGGQYKHVIGRPIFKEEKGDSISIAFLYSPPTITSNSTSTTADQKSISLNQQIILAIALTLIYQFLVYVYRFF